MSLCIHDYIVSGSGKWQIAIGCAVCKRGKVELREPARPPIMRKVSFSQCCRENSIFAPDRRRSSKFLRDGNDPTSGPRIRVRRLKMPEQLAILAAPPPFRKGSESQRGRFCSGCPENAPAQYDLTNFVRFL